MKNIFISGFYLSIMIAAISCTSDSVEEPFDCNTTDLTISLGTVSNLTSCAVNNGSVSVQASGGASPYQFRINGGAFQANATFSNLAAGQYTVEVKDANGCIKVLTPSPTLSNASTTLAVASVEKTSDTQCNGGNGSLTVTASGGVAPYTYKLGSGSFGNSNIFANLENGNYTVTVKDADNCQVTSNQSVIRGSTGISYDAEIKNIISASCNFSTCHGGGQSPNLTSYAGVSANQAKIKAELVSGRMPTGQGTITAENRQKIICWIDDGAANN
ncbi:MAG: SprB repeat-containing protein [Cyclobacteriaceae bacterium]|jgi:hypothetical protein|nr:SprB repeat-containing protein [Cyclobacteriaceae bacterium]